MPYGACWTRDACACAPVVGMLMRASIIVDGLMMRGDTVVLHPALLEWQAMLQSYRRRWWRAPRQYNALSCYAEMEHVPAAALFVPHIAETHAQQYWVASPYHARLGREGLRLMPESMLPWSAEDARAICTLLNPLLHEDGMCMHAVHAALIVSCDVPLSVSPQDFPSLNGGLLPNVSPDGVDGGRLMRLLSEIQMLLHQSPLVHRRQQGLPDIHGLWFWGATEDACDAASSLTVATRHPYLQSIVDSKDAEVVLTEAEQYPDLCRDGWLAPQTYLLGAGYALLLDKPWWYIKRKQQTWKPEAVQESWSIQDLLATR